MRNSREISGESAAGRIMLLMIRGYRRYVSPFLPSSCIYEPTCSRYAEAAVRRFGFLRGTWLSILRVLRCNPFRKGGYDPVPEKWEERRRRSAGKVK